MSLDSSITILKGIGPKSAATLNRLNIFTVKDLINHFPRDYEDRSMVTPLSQLEEDTSVTVRCRITTSAENTTAKGKILTKLKVKDTQENTELELIWFNRKHLIYTFRKGEEYFFFGKIIKASGKFQMVSPEFEKISQKELLSSARIVPVYPLTYGMTQSTLRSFIKTAIEYAESSDLIKEFIPEEILVKHSLDGYRVSIRNIHFPSDENSFFSARKRLAFNELFLMQLGLWGIKERVSKAKKSIPFVDLDIRPLLAALPFELTNAQQQVVNELFEDLRQGKQMNRLIQGDVGSGKTAVALIICYVAIKNGYKAALMAPTEVLAQQHFKSVCEIFVKLGIEVFILTGSTKKAERDHIHNMLTSPLPCLLISTHAVLYADVEISRLGLVVTDEQHRFGVRQRAVLAEKAEKGAHPHVLVMSATPIPRTLALILYSDLDISIIDQLPPGRQKIDTYCVTSSHRQRAYGFIKKELEQGRQAYVVCPLIEENEKLELEAVLTYTEKLQKEFHEYNVAFLHGKMKNSEKQEIMEQFSRCELHIIVSTTVIEVGINVPNSTIMLIENAERFGLSQLHQLRGRVGRGSHRSYCILVTDSKSQVTKQRMKAMKETTDGFKLSALDLELRGSGDFFGTRQHGMPEFKIANIYKDMEILKLCQDEAKFAVSQGYMKRFPALKVAVQDFLFGMGINRREKEDIIL